MINLYLQYFKHSNILREKELIYCTKHNINNNLIDKIYLFLENIDDKQDWMINDKVEIILFEKRMTFRNFIEYSNNVDSNNIHIISNLDIFFDETLSKLIVNNIDNHLVTLTRWNIDTKTKQAKHWNINCSQDVWIWKSKIDLSKFDLDYYIGQVGCDNAVCGEFHEVGYKVINPSMDLRSYHLHQDETRNYTDDDVVRKRLYLLNPTKDWNSSQIQYWKDCTNFKPKNKEV